jgi:membrane-bound lytic murein transglycosylase B
MEPLALMVASALLVAPAIGMDQARAQSQSGGLSSLFGGLFSGSKADAPAQAPGSNGPVPNGAVPWSGEDGASGHPLMTADAIRQAASNFDNCIAGLWPDAARRNISQDSFSASHRAFRPTCTLWTCSMRSRSSPSRSGIIWTYW